MPFLTEEQLAKLAVWKAALLDILIQYNAAAGLIDELMRAHENILLTGNVAPEPVWNHIVDELDEIRTAAIDAAKALPKKDD